MADLTFPAAEKLNRALGSVPGEMVDTPNQTSSTKRYDHEYNRMMIGDRASDELFSRFGPLWDQHKAIECGRRERGASFGEGGRNATIKCIGRGRDSRVFRCSAEGMKVGSRFFCLVWWCPLLASDVWSFEIQQLFIERLIFKLLSSILMLFSEQSTTRHQCTTLS